MVDVRIDGLEPISRQYDSRGRLSSFAQGTGDDRREMTLGYDPEGFLASLTDPLQRSTSFDYDQVGRVRTQTLPDGRSVALTYDENGNVTLVTPPGRATDSPTPPSTRKAHTLPPTPVLTSYDYNLDR